MGTIRTFCVSLGWAWVLENAEKTKAKQHESPEQFVWDEDKQCLCYADTGTPVGQHEVCSNDT